MAASPSSGVEDERFVFGDVIGRGSMGEVLRAHDRRMGCPVAVKKLRDLGPDQVYWLKREFRVLAGVAHPNLVELFDLVVDARGGFFTMELLDGASFLDHVRGPGFGQSVEGRSEAPSGAEIARLRAVLRQLTEGLATLHASGRLHCDIKPANVMVTSQGRAVLLDFGLAAPLRSEGSRSIDAEAFFGTVEYMAPEQAWGEPLSPASDWYSVGVMIFEALTGRLPFEGTPEEIIVAKKGRPPSLAQVVPGVPPDLDRLVAGLLDPDPLRRPSPTVIAEQLSAVPASALSLRATPSFVGRERELSLLFDVFARVRAGGAAVVHVHGHSGMGKSALVRELTRSIEASSSVFWGRCHPQESVPYRGLDAAVDMMSREVAAAAETNAPVRAPAHLAALARLFPVLRSVPGWEAHGVEDESIAPQELRRRAIGALGELIAALAADRPVVIWIDDLHWIGADGAALLGDLLHIPGAGRILWLLSYRREEIAEDTLQRIRSGAAGVAHEIALRPLQREEIALLAEAHLGGPADITARYLDAIATESAGNPFLVGELSRWAAVHGGEPGVSGLADVVRDRIGALRPSARRLLEVVALAGRPVSRGVALEAAGLLGDPEPVIPELRLEQLLRSAAHEEGLALEPGHDRIREAVLDELSPERRRECHHDLAAALEARPRADPEVLLEHLLGAGERAKARGYAVSAAEQAATALAFNRAAQHYRTALNLGAGSAAPWSLRERLASALASAGRTAESADAYEETAAEVAAEDATRASVLTLRRNAAEQHLRGGQVKRGVALMREVMAAIGVRYPETVGEAIATVLALRGYVLLRGFAPRVAAAPTPQRVLEQMETCWSAGLGLNMLDILRSAVFQARHTALALRSGDPKNMVRAITSEITYSGCEGSAAKRARVAQFREEGRRWIEQHADPDISALMDLSSGAAWYFEGRFGDALADLAAAERVFSQRHDGITWEVLNCRMYRAWSLVWRGDLAELGRVLPGLIDEAHAEHATLALAGLCSAHPNVLWLAADRAEEAAARTREAIAPFSRDTFQSPHYFELIAETRIALYQGDGEAAFRRVEEAWPKLKAIQFLRMQFFRVELCYLRALAALAAISGRMGKARERCIRVAEAEARRLAGEDLATARPLALLLEAGLAGARGREAEAQRGFEGAARAADMAGLGLHAAGARIRCGDGAGEAWMTEQGVVKPARMAAVVAPAGR